MPPAVHQDQVDFGKLLHFLPHQCLHGDAAVSIVRNKSDVFRLRIKHLDHPDVIFYIVLILLYIRFIYEDTNYDGLILYFLTLTVGRFLYFDFTVKSFLETMRGVLENLPLLVIMSAYSGFVCWYGFHVGFLLKSNGVILSTFLAHLFMDCSIFLLHKTGILKHVIRKI